MEAGQENTTHHFVRAKPNGKLIVLQHGHACTFDDASDPRGGGMGEAVDQLLAGGFGVLAAYMPHMRPNQCRTMSHADLFDLKLKEGSALKFFLEPVAVSLNALRPRYKEVHMAGLSGGGWTTTLYAALNKLNDRKRNIMTVEDPIEYDIPGICQSQVKPEIGLTFANALRSFPL